MSDKEVVNLTEDRARQILSDHNIYPKYPGRKHADDLWVFSQAFEKDAPPRFGEYGYVVTGNGHAALCHPSKSFDEHVAHLRSLRPALSIFGAINKLDEANIMTDKLMHLRYDSGYVFFGKRPSYSLDLTLFVIADNGKYKVLRNVVSNAIEKALQELLEDELVDQEA